MLLSENELDKVWEQVYQRFQFTPSMDIMVIPFELPQPWVVYDISDVFESIDNPSLTEWYSMTERLNNVVNQVLLSCMAPGERLYALDWHHSGFLFDPRNPEEQKSLFVEDGRYWGGGYTAYFPLYIPDGDYYFFLSQDFRFGYFGHPWRKEIWIFGEMFVHSFQEAVEREQVLSGFRRRNNP